jgi:O-antigen/teichoic acid export membrane protein
VRLLRRNLLTTYSVYAASLLSGLALTPIIVHELGKEEYGVWAFIGSLTIYLALLDLGVGPSVVRYAAEQRGRRAHDETSALASVGLLLYGVVGLVSVGAGVVLAWLVPLVLDVPDELEWPARAAALLVVAGIVARFPLGLFGNLLIGQQRYDVVNLANLVSIAIYSALVAAVLTRGGGIVLLAWLALAATLVRLVLPLLWLRRELPGLRLARGLVTRPRVRELLGFSWHNFLIHLASKVVFSTDVVVVGVVLGAEAAALYAIPAKLFAMVFGIGAAGVNLLYPAFSELEGAGDEARQRAYLRAGLRGGMAVILLVGLPLVLIPDQLIGAWIGEGFEDSTWVLALLGLALLLHQPSHVLAQFLIARARQRPLARVLVAMAAVNVLLSVLLASIVGLWGVALGTLVTELVATLVLVPWLAARASDLSYAEVARAAARPLAPALPLAGAVLVGIARAYDPDDLLSLVPLGLLWVAAFAPLVWRFGLSAEERRALTRQLRRRERAAAPGFEASSAAETPQWS